MRRLVVDEVRAEVVGPGARRVHECVEGVDIGHARHGAWEVF